MEYDQVCSDEVVPSLLFSFVNPENEIAVARASMDSLLGLNS
jgi:hypothetical protein